MKNYLVVPMLSLARKYKTFVVCIFFLAGSWLSGWPIVQTQTNQPLDLAAIDAYLQKEVATHRLPGLAVAIVEGDRILWMKGYGKARAGQPVTPQTQFYIGSCTKSFTALAAMQLVEQGKLDLDAPVQRYLPWFEVVDAVASAQITVRHLLNHTSGLSESGDPQSNLDFASLTEQAQALQLARLTAPIGTKFQYFNSNYRLLGLLIEQVSGQSYAAYMHDHVLTPLAMSHTVANPAETSSLAQGYGQFFGLPLPRTQDFYAGSLPSGYLISTAEDLAHYLIALLNDGRSGNTQVVQPDMLARIFTLPAGVDNAQITPPANVVQTFGTPTEISYGYGMGWIVGRSAQGVQVAFHGGNLLYFHAEILLLPQQKRGLAILMNQGSLIRQMLDPQPLWLGLANALLGQGLPTPTSREWVYLILVMVVVIDLGIKIFRFWRLSHWDRKVAQQIHAVRWLRALMDVVIPLVFLFLPYLLGLAVGGKGRWSDLFSMLPDVALWLWVGIVLSLARGVAKVLILTHQQADKK